MTLYFDYFSLTALSILIALILGVLSLTIAGCYFDQTSRQAGLNKLPEGREWVHIPKKRLENFRSSLRESSTSKDDELPLLTPKDPSTLSNRTPFSQKAAASRLDQEEKHKRMIEAVYIASGRAVPAHFSTSTRTAVAKSNRPKPLTSSGTSDIATDKTQSSDSGSVRTMRTMASRASDREDNTQTPQTPGKKLSHEPTSEQIERASLAFIRELEKTAHTQPNSEPRKK